MTRFFLGLLLGIVLIFPGIELLRWLAVDVFRVYDQMTLTEAFLGMIVLLLSVIFVRGIRSSGGPQGAPGPGMGGWQVELRPPPPAVRARRRRAADPQERPPEPPQRRPRTRAEPRVLESPNVQRRANRPPRRPPGEPRD